MYYGSLATVSTSPKRLFSPYFVVTLIQYLLMVCLNNGSVDVKTAQLAPTRPPSGNCSGFFFNTIATPALVSCLLWCAHRFLEKLIFTSSTSVSYTFLNVLEESFLKFKLSFTTNGHFKASAWSFSCFFRASVRSPKCLDADSAAAWPGLSRRRCYRQSDLLNSRSASGLPVRRFESPIGCLVYLMFPHQSRDFQFKSLFC